MSKHKIVFYGTRDSEDTELQAYYNIFNEIYISIDMNYNQFPDFITLDKATAIKLVRVLKREISKIQEDE